MALGGRGMRVQIGVALVALRTGGLLLWDTVERAGETGSGGHGEEGVLFLFYFIVFNFFYGGGRANDFFYLFFCILESYAGDSFCAVRLAEGGVQERRKSKTVKKRLNKTSTRAYTNTQTYEQTQKQSHEQLITTQANTEEGKPGNCQLSQ